MIYFLLAQEGRHYRSVMSSENLNEVVDFAREARVTGIIARAFMPVDFSGEPKLDTGSAVKEAFQNLIGGK
jgi:hypothetical protein